MAAAPLTVLPIVDLNALAFDSGSGFSSPSATIDENHIRSSVHERLLSVQQASSGRLKFQSDTLASKILLCNTTQGITTAYGVEIADNAALPIASAFNGKVDLNLRNVTARHEVIVSAGTFQSPQLVSITLDGSERAKFLNKQQCS